MMENLYFIEADHFIGMDRKNFMKIQRSNCVEGSNEFVEKFVV